METTETIDRPRDDLVATLVSAALSRPESEREQFIAEACGGDAELGAHVRRHVMWEARLKGFLLTPVVPSERLDRPFAPGDSVLRGRYRVIREAGQGGMGVVFEAEDTKLGLRVALKCPRFEFRRRLTQEVAKAIKVNHPNVCRVFEIHTEETPAAEIDFLTMEFLAGITLAARLAEAPRHWLKTAEGIAVARQICEGLEAVHAAGIVHRDLKASNVMLSKNTAGEIRAVIMDFGIAQGPDLFSSAMRGTPAYIAPELWKGQPATVRSDIYALGVMLYEMACGRKPFDEGVSWRERLQSAPPSPPEAGDRLRAVVARCLQPDPAKRFASVAEVEAAIWPPSRRGVVYGVAAMGLAASGAAAWTARESIWPTSPVRLAILPPVIAAQAAAEAPLVNGFLQDISYRFKSLRRSRRPISVFSTDQASAAGIARPVEAGLSLGATHALSTELRPAPGGRWTVSIALSKARSGAPIRQWTREAAPGSRLSGQLFSLQSKLVLELMGELQLRAEPKRQSLGPEAYADYLRGIYFARVDYENAAQAIPCFERVIAAAPRESLGYAGLAEALLGAQYATGDRSLQGKALTALATAEQLDPDNAHVHLMSGRLNAFNGLYERALADFRRASELDPNDAQAFIGMGYALLYPGRYQEAEAAFLAALAAQPGYYKPHMEAGIYYWEVSKWPEAERHWLEAVRLNPGHALAKLDLAVLYLRTGRTAEAERQIQDSLKLRRTLPALHLLGDLQDMRGHYQEAIASYEEAIRVGPPDYTTWGALAAVHRKVGRGAGAQSAFRQGLEEAERGLTSNPRDPDRLAWSAFYHAGLGEAARARSRAAEAEGVASPPAARVRHRLVMTFDELGDTESALRAINGAPPDLLREFRRDAGLSARLRRDPRFVRLTQ